MSDNRDIPSAPPAFERQRTQSSDGSQEASLSTTPTQSQVAGLGHAAASHQQQQQQSSAAGTIRSASGSSRTTDAAAVATPSTRLDLEAWQRSVDVPSESGRPSHVSQRDSSVYDGSQVGTIGRAHPPPPSSASSAGGDRATTATSRPPALIRDALHSHRSVSYVASDFDTVSGASASEFSSGGEEDHEGMSQSVASHGRGRASEQSGRCYPSATGSRSGAGYVLNAASPAARASSAAHQGASAKAPRRPSATNRDANRVHRHSQAIRGDGGDDDGRYGPLDEDDEVEVFDRGEELVRRRMKARQREKALRKKREKQAERERNRQSQAVAPGSPRLHPGSGFSAGRPASPSPHLDRAGRPTTIMLPPSAGFHSLQQGTLSPTSQPALSSPGLVARVGGNGPSYPSPHAHIRRPSASQTSTAASNQQYPQLHTPQHTTPAGPRTASHGGAASGSQDVFAESLRPISVAGKASTDAGSSVAGSVRADEDAYDREDSEERDTIVSLADRRGHRDAEDVEAGQRYGDGGRGGGGDDSEGAPDGGNGDDEEEEEEDDLEDVEYTLKDRQDAINVEHPFGLPIWKPALYKKSRSVTRNAESALHLIPSAAAERHLLPGNLLWTILFGFWLAVVCYVCAIVLNFVPYGGSRYARVIWELGGYLFWPFGKYVEVEVDPESPDRSRPADEFRDPSDEAAAAELFDATAAPIDLQQTYEPLAPGDADATLRSANSGAADGSSSGGSDARRSTPSGSHSGESSRTSHSHEGAGANESSSLKAKAKAAASYGATYFGEDGILARTEQERIAAESAIYGYVVDDNGNEVNVAQRAGGKVAFGLVYGLLVFPLMGLVCLACWGAVFTIPMAKLNWALIKNLAVRPLAMHFRSAPGIERSGNDGGHDGDNGEHLQVNAARKLFLPLKPGQNAPRSKSFNQGKGKGKLHRRSKILLCTYRAVGSQYYKYTVGGVNILFVNTLPLVFFTIFDFFVIESYVHHHHIDGGFLAFISGQGVIFMLALASVIPLSYFIGMAVASISAQSSIGMGAVINATFGSIIEIILYAIALTQQKARLVEGSLIGSILAGVLLMPGLSMCSGATRRKEQRFNARSAGVTSTMLIMAIIGILTPTLFYQIYGTFQLTCEGCPQGSHPGDTWTCKRCFYEHVDPATDPFFQENVRGLMYTCTVILVLSYGIGLWFSLRTHASQIWQNPQPAQQPHHHGAGASVTTAHNVATLPSAQRASIYKRLVPPSVMQQLLPTANTHQHPQQSPRPHSQVSATASNHDQQSVHATIKGNTPQQQREAGHTKSATSRTASESHEADPSLRLQGQFSPEDYERAMALTATAFQTALQQDREQRAAAAARQSYPQGESRQVAAATEAAEDDGGHGGHDAPSWSRAVSVSVLLGCTVLYAIIAEILVDVVDVVLDGSGIDEKFLGITLFALVPNTTEFMNAMSFAINGNIALSMEIGSAYALQVCLIQIPAMVAFSAYYNGVNDVPENVAHQSFTLIFPRWDVIAIIFSVFLLTYTYIEARSNYYRGSICILSYVVLVAGFFFAPNTGDSEMPGDSTTLGLMGGMGGVSGGWSQFAAAGGAFGGSPVATSTPSMLGIAEPAYAPVLGLTQWVGAMVTSLWAR
ncbi:hypothetical protein ACQY0O_002795 [Thecaphora frezii]